METKPKKPIKKRGKYDEKLQVKTDFMGMMGAMFPKPATPKDKIKGQ